MNESCLYKCSTSGKRQGGEGHWETQLVLDVTTHGTSFKDESTYSNNERHVPIPSFFCVD